MRDRDPAGRFACSAFRVDVDPLLVAGRFGLMRSWVISIQSLTPTSVPTAPLRSLKSLNTRISLLLWSDSNQPRQIAISGTVVGTTSSAWVLATTCATLTLGAVSIRLALPLGNPITAISVTTRSIVLADVSGRSHAMTILDLPLATWGEFFTAETSC